MARVSLVRSTKQLRRLALDLVDLAEVGKAFDF
jgi:hypothetical protein